MKKYRVLDVKRKKIFVIFGYDSQNLKNFSKNLVKDASSNFKHLRITPHTHHPVDDAKGNAEALLEMKKMGLKLKL